jgi:glyoxylase-like metal-dependent hydrolase (beta-lactamase superfamily II)
MDLQYEVHVMTSGEADVPGPEVYWMSHWNTWERLSFNVVLVRGGGKTVLINTGPPADLSRLNSSWVSGYGEQRAAMRRSEEQRLENLLRGVGLTPEAIDYLIITPLQAYATGNIPLFPNATICLSKRGWIEDFHAPRFHLHVPRDLRIPTDVLIHLVCDAWERVQLLEDEEEILPGIQTFWVGAHHRSSIAVRIATSAGAVVVSDCCFKYPNVENNIPLGVQESLEECLKAYDRIRKEADIVVPLYDPEVLERYPGGLVAR